MNININSIIAFAKTEWRMSSRLSRYWLFLISSYLFAIGLIVAKSVWHAFGSSVSASVGMISPRFNFSESGAIYLFVFILGLIFLAFDIRARDERERMIAVLDSRPYSNIDLVFGRFIGMFLCAWIPVVGLIVVLQAIGWLLPELGSPFGSTIEPVSLFSFPFFIALPAMAFSCALVVTVTLLIRQRQISLYISSGVLTGLIYLSSFNTLIPPEIASALDIAGYNQTQLPSDWTPSVATDFIGWLQRSGFLLISLGLLFVAALVHPRKENGNRNNLMIMATLTGVAGVALIVTVLQYRIQQESQIQDWLAARQQVSPSTFSDIIAMQGSVVIDPDSGIDAQLEVNIQAPDNSPLENVTFSLNPGYRIDEVKDQNGQSLNYKFEQGILSITLIHRLEAGQETEFALHFSGQPNTNFGYLDSNITPTNLTGKKLNVAVLGSKNAIFAPHYVALMPGISWLPSTVKRLDNSNTPTPTTDYFEIRLEVTVPQDWLVAGPGLRTEKARTETQVEFEFSPATAVAEVALLAAPFASYSVTIEDILFEVLLHPDHDINLAIFDRSKGQIVRWVKDKLSLAKEAGLIYSFKSFSLVEVPNTLRGYEGEWRANTALAPPAMVLMKENSLPTVRFDFDARATFGSRPLLDEDDGLAKVTTQRLIEFFRNDYTGGNLFTGIARSFFGHQVSASGTDAIALDYTLQQLTSLVLSGEQGYFSVAKMDDVIAAMLFTMGTTQRNTIDERMKRSYSRDEVWTYANQVALDQLQPWDNPSLAVDLLALKGGSLARLIYDLLGPVKSGQLIARLLADKKGQSYNRQDLIAAGKREDSELGKLFEDWFSNTGLPGFIAQNVRLYQLPTTDNGDNKYQLKMQIKNDEAVTGYLRLAWLNDRRGAMNRSDPIRVPANSTIEYGVVLSQAPYDLYIEPYLSLNRDNFLVKRFIADEIGAEAEDEFNGVRLVSNINSDRIVIDDLDDTFKVTGAVQSLSSDAERKGMFDQGLPVVKDNYPEHWSRRTIDSAWGKYRKTTAYIGAGNGESKATLTAIIPHPGRWKLEIHLPDVKMVQYKQLGDMTLDIVAENNRQTILFETDGGNSGWNTIGEYELPAGNVEIEISNQTNGKVVFVDALAWIPEVVL